jgi:hypothetical protein
MPKKENIVLGGGGSHQCNPDFFFPQVYRVFKLMPNFIIVLVSPRVGWVGGEGETKNIHGFLFWQREF